MLCCHKMLYLNNLKQLGSTPLVFHSLKDWVFRTRPPRHLQALVSCSFPTLSGSEKKQEWFNSQQRISKMIKTEKQVYDTQIYFITVI